MTMDGTSSAQSRVARMTAELQVAVVTTSAADLQSWGGRAAARVPRVLGRRATTLGRTLSSFAQGAVAELRAAAEAQGRGDLQAHLVGRGARAVDSARELGNSAILRFGEAADFASRLRADPASVAPVVAGAALAFLAHADEPSPAGGQPAATNGSALRSFMANSVVFGGTAESLIFATLELAALVQDHLPEPHDPLWDELASAGRKLALGVASGLGSDPGEAPVEGAPSA
jgi:hypothetical protein